MHRSIAQIANSLPTMPYDGSAGAMTGHFDAALSMPTATGWLDRSGNARDMGAGGAPKQGVMGKLPCGRFAIGDYYSRAGWFAAQSQCTVFAVCRIDQIGGDGTNVGGIIDECTSTNEHGSRVAGITNSDPHVYSNSGTIFTKTVKFGVPFVLAWSRNGTTARGFINGMFQAQGPMTNTSLGTASIMKCAYTFGARQSSGLFSQALILANALDDAMVTHISRQMLRKWRLHPGMMGI